MAKINERQLLEKLVRTADRDRHLVFIRRSRRENVVIRSIVALLLVVLTFALGPLNWTGVLVAVGAFVLGALIALDASRVVRSREWELIAQHLDRGSIRARLGELERD